MFKTSELAKLLGVERSFLHYYDKEGIIKPQKNEHNFRLYSENDLIALASSRYYRSMNMPLDDLKQIMHSSDLGDKVKAMSLIQTHIADEIQNLKDIYVVTDYALAIYQTAYNLHGFQTARTTATDYVATVAGGKIDTEVVSDPMVQKMLNQFPFISYAFYFPKGSLIHEESFSYTAGPATIHDLYVKKNLPLPKEAVFIPETNGLITVLTRNTQRDGFKYSDFEEAREYARLNQLSLTGEAMAYCVFTNYDYENQDIKFVVQVFTK